MGLKWQPGTRLSRNARCFHISSLRGFDSGRHGHVLKATVDSQYHQPSALPGPCLSNGFLGTLHTGELRTLAAPASGFPLVTPDTEIRS